MNIPSKLVVSFNPINKDSRLRLTYTADDLDTINKDSRLRLTYTADDLDNPGKIYTGRCSGTCDMTSQQILDNRKAGHHRNLGNLQLDQVTDFYPAIRGREQQVLDSLTSFGKPYYMAKGSYSTSIVKINYATHDNSTQ
ncbi:MAG: hypothetical protein ACJASU_000251 [Cognaticolwellia sp.]